MNAITDHKTSFINPDSLLDVSRLRAIAELAKTRGDVRFMLGGGVLFDTPMTKAERLALPAPQVADVEYLDLPQDRFARARTQDPAFDAFCEGFHCAACPRRISPCGYPAGRPVKCGKIDRNC